MIFKNGLLKKQYLNVNYFSFNGVDVELHTEDNVTTKKLKAISCGICFFKDGSFAAIKDIQISEKTVREIEPGEFIWYLTDRGTWKLGRHSNKQNSRNYRKLPTVPLLIAGNVKEAIKFKGWDDER